jgi:hypothetical protein
MDQDMIVGKLVGENLADLRNKIVIDGEDLSAFATAELGRTVSSSTLSDAIQSFKNRTYDDRDVTVVDAATALCHQVADRVWGKCIDQEADEWEEIDIATDWIIEPDSDGSEVRVVVRPS